MKHETFLQLIVSLVFLAVFNIIFFVIGGIKHSVSVWIAYGFIHFSYIMFVVTPRMIEKDSATSSLRLSLSFISAVYFLVNLIAGLLFIFLKNQSYSASLVVYCITTGIYVLLLSTNWIANIHTAKHLQRKHRENAFVNIASSRVKALIGKAAAETANLKIEAAYDSIHSSPSKSDPSVLTLENSVMEQISVLENSISTGNAEKIIRESAEIILLVEERNRKLHFTQ